MELVKFMENLNKQASQLEMIGLKGDVMFNGIKQSIEKLIFKTDRTNLTLEEVKVLDAFHDLNKFKLAFNKYRELVAQNASEEELSKAIIETIIK